MGARDYRYALGAVAAGTSLLAAMPASAQSLAPTRDELTRQQPEAAPSKSTLNVVGGVERSPCPLADPEFNDVRVKLSDVQFNNLKGATDAELRSSWAEYAGTDQPVAVICEIRDRAATYLRDKGYLAAVQVPTQRIENGVVRLEVLYARVTTIRARGETSGAEAKLAGYLSKLTQDEIFDRNRAERYLLLARDLPGYNVQLTLKPAGTGPGELIGEVSVIRQAYAVDAVIQNLAARETGRWGGQVRGQVFGLTGLGDSTFISAYSTLDFKEQQILQVGHSFRPGSEGLTINGQLTYAWTKPTIARNPGDPLVKARTLFATLGVSYPLVRTQSRNVTLGGGFDYVDQKVNFIGPLTRDHLRVAFLRADFDAIDLKSRRPKWKIGGGLEFRQGLHIFGATDRCCTVGETPPSRADGRATATVIRANATGEFALGKSLAIGLFQCLSLIPGVSRSGATIVGALMLGVSKRAATEFSFFLSLPTMLGAVTFDLIKSRHELDFGSLTDIGVGFVVAFVSGLFVVKWLLGYVSANGFALFGWWRIIVGGAALAALVAGY